MSQTKGKCQTFDVQCGGFQKPFKIPDFLKYSGGNFIWYSEDINGLGGKVQRGSIKETSEVLSIKQIFPVFFFFNMVFELCILDII